MAQQNLYNENQRFFKWVIKDFKKFNSYKKNLLLVIVTLIIINTLSITNNLLFMIYFFLVYIILVILFYLDAKKNKGKIPLKVTPRVKRIIVTCIILIIVATNSFFINYNSNLLLFYYLYLTTLIIIIYPLIMTAIVINKPVEKVVYYSYYFKAKKKLNSMKSLKVIGITGSYGKTSSKNILSDILNVKYNALPSPKNFNTPYGLIITINNYLDKFDNIFIAEMGAYKKGEIKELVDLVKPKYGILTKIGTAHLESFGTEENIQQTKFELIENLPLDGVGVLNKDDEKQTSYKLENKCKILWIGIDNKDVDVHASNIVNSSEGMTFDITFKGNTKKYKFSTKLLGHANIYNILAALALSKEFNLTIEQMQMAVSNVRPVEHRLELKKAGNITYIDDAYNSNPTGAKMALDVLNQMKALRVVLTPGMIELGQNQKKYNKEFGRQIASSCDYVILVGKKQTEDIYEGLIDKKFSKDKIHIVKDLFEGLDIVKKEKKEVVVLLENDLPDMFNE